MEENRGRHKFDAVKFRPMRFWPAAVKFRAMISNPAAPEGQPKARRGEKLGNV